MDGQAQSNATLHRNNAKEGRGAVRNGPPSKGARLEFNRVGLGAGAAEGRWRPDEPR
jgi:hypothetical protein